VVFPPSLGSSATPRTVPLARCLVRHAALLADVRRFDEAGPRATEALRLFDQAGDLSGVADACQVLARVHRGKGEAEIALEYLRREEELRRKLAA